MAERERGNVIVVENFHMKECGKPPAIEAGKENQYTGYFENAIGEQVVFIGNKKTKEAYLYMGDAGWGEKFPVVDGVAKDLVMHSQELLWLSSCWYALTGKFVNPLKKENVAASV